MKVLRSGGVPILSWADDLEEKTLAQARNLALLPFAIDHVALMPDAHVGYGMPIGGVLFADRAVVPYAIGVDIGCGVSLLETDLTVDDLGPHVLDALLARLASRIPVGFEHHRGGVDRDRAESEIGLPRPGGVQEDWLAHALPQLGTLGSGNHFLEVQRDAEGSVAVMLHTGSRSLGKAICDAFHRRALALCARRGLPLPHRELAWLPDDEPDHADYLAAMRYALRYAEVNRSRILDAVEASLASTTRVSRLARTIDIHHNFAATEHHAGPDGRSVEGLVHRKGAVRATAGAPVLVPGSMGSASWVGVGLGRAESFETCQHGAGRTMSRTAARHARTSGEVFAELERTGIRLHAGDPRDVAEEAASAYKDVDHVMALSADLVRPLRRLTPLAVLKG